MARKVKEYTLKDGVCDECGDPFKAKTRLPAKLDGKLRCPKCRENRVRNFYRKQPHMRAKTRDMRLRREYGLEPEQYDTLLRHQGGTCAICHQVPTEGTYLDVDHDHSTKVIRGLLCQRCNRSIWSLGESSSTLRSAISYLMRNDPVRSWDSYFMQIAEHVATRSKDRSTQVGSVLVRDRNILSTGFNGFPRGVNDKIESRHERPAKYMWTIHAEENALLNAGRNGVSTDGATIYVTPLSPCIQCAKAIVQCGVREVVFEARGDTSRWDKSTDEARGLLAACGVVIRAPE